jgi:hypothetical protein
MTMQRFLIQECQKEKFNMKIFSVLAFIGIAAIPVSSCNKESKNAIDNSTSLVGKWEIRQVAGNFTTNYPPGNGSVVEFTNSTYSTGSPNDHIFIQGAGPSQGSYKIVADGTVNINTGMEYPAGQFANRMILNDDTISNKLFYQVKGDKLIFVSGNFLVDGGVQKTYQRQ